MLKWFHLSLLLAIGVVVAATSVNNLLNIISIEESDLLEDDSDCFKNDVLHYAMSSLNTCLSGCTELHLTFIDSSS